MSTDERYALLADRAKIAFVTSVMAVSAAHQNPWLLVFAPTEHVLAYADTSRFSCFCTTCAAFAWLAYALGQVLPFGALYALVALEALVTWDVPVFRAPPVYFASVLLLWITCYLAPLVVLLPAVLVPLIERKWLASLLRVPAVCMVLFTTPHA